MRVAHRSIALLLAGLFICVAAAAVRAQSPLNPTIVMSVTLPDGHTQELTAHEGGLATVKVGAREYGFRPTMFDTEGSRMAVTIFDMGSPSEPVRELGTVDIKGGMSAVASRTTPAFKVTARRSNKAVPTT